MSDNDTKIELFSLVQALVVLIVISAMVPLVAYVIKGNVEKSKNTSKCNCVEYPVCDNNLTLKLSDDKYCLVPIKE